MVTISAFALPDEVIEYTTIARKNYKGTQQTETSATE